MSTGHKDKATPDSNQPSSNLKDSKIETSNDSSSMSSEQQSISSDVHDYENQPKPEIHDLDPEEVLDDMYRTLTIEGQGGSKDLERQPTLASGQPAVIPDIPDKFAGWGLAVVIGCSMFNFNTWGSNSAFALYLQDYLSNNRFPGTSKVDYGIIGGLTFGSGLTFGPLINFMVGVIGLKPTIVVGIIIQFVGTMLASFSTKLWHIYVCQGVLQGIGMALICIANINIVPQWFAGGKGGKRNVAMGFVAAGSGIGGIVYNAGLQPLLKNHGYHWSLRTQSIMCAVLNCVALCLIKSRNKHIKPIYKVFDTQIWTNFGCICLILWEMFTLFGYVTLMYNLGDFTRSLGYDSKHASTVSTMTSVGIIYVG
ncbi:unnamed protein product [Ambrosiozyma monospora]|uniref:Unnamed protein product n=1 Tax=Ambrosiozyma monospora TaxID=43982 RepID=A0ACB5T853_AMBMO|nr:unnamed protein product [Ambrosiozyma monospora]